MSKEETAVIAGIPPDRCTALLEVAHDPFSRLVGVELLELSPGHSRVALTLEDCHLNSLAVAHGGAVFALADQAFALASNSHGQAAVAINMSISYVAPSTTGDRLIAEANEQHLGGRTALYHIEVRTESGKLVASCQGLVYRKRESLAGLQPHGKREG